MYLSRVELQPERRETMRALAQPQLLHGAIEQSFSGTRERRLWRMDWLNRRCHLLVLSRNEPDFTALLAQFGAPDAQPHWETRDYQPLLAKLENGQSWRFRLKANPIHSVHPEGAQTKRGKVVAHVTPTQQKQWLLTRAQALGIGLDEETFDVVHTQWYTFDKGAHQRVTLRTASFEGLLTVADAERFRDVLQTGVGRAKAYGCGLLTIIALGGSSHG